MSSGHNLSASDRFTEGLRQRQISKSGKEQNEGVNDPGQYLCFSSVLPFASLANGDPMVGDCVYVSDSTLVCSITMEAL